MPLSAAVLKADIIAQLTAAYGSPDDPAQLAKFAEAIATAIVTHITTMGVVNVAGVTPGGGAAVGVIT